MNNIEFKYLNITEDDAEFGLWVSTVGFQSIDGHDLSDKKPSYRLLFQS